MAFITVIQSNGTCVVLNGFMLISKFKGNQEIKRKERFFYILKFNIVLESSSYNRGIASVVSLRGKPSYPSCWYAHAATAATPAPNTIFERVLMPLVGD